MNNYYNCPNCGEKVHDGGSICENCGEFIVKAKYIPHLNALGKQNRKTEKKEVAIKIAIIVAFLLLFICFFYPRSVSMVISHKYKTMSNNLKILIISENGDNDTFIIDDRKKIIEILEHIEIFKGSWTPKRKRINTTDQKSYFLILDGDGFYIDINLIGKKYVSVRINDFSNGNPFYSDLVFRLYGKGFDSEEFLELIMD